MSKQTNELGTLAIVVLKARNLHDKHSFYKQDVYAQVSLNGTVQNTPVDIKGGQHPEWDAEIRLPVLKDPGEKHRMLEVSCWAKENKEDDLLGTAKVDIAETLRTGEFDDWLKLETNGSYRGEVYLEMTYYAAAAPTPAPLTRRPSKLPSSLRIARPPPNAPPTTQGSSPPASRPILPQGLSTAPKRSHLLPPPSQSSPPSSSPPSILRGRDALPALLEEPPSDKLKSVPTILRPGKRQSSPLSSSRTSSPDVHHLPQSLSGSSTPPTHNPVPPVLRPGNRSPSPHTVSRPSLSDPYHLPQSSCGSSTPPTQINPQHSAIPKPVYQPSSHAAVRPHYTPPPGYSTPPPTRASPGYSATPKPVYQPPTAEPWRPAAPSDPIPFPVPTVPPIYEPSAYNPRYASPPPPPPLGQYPDSPDPRPTGTPRYSTPLPLPGSPPRNNTHVPPAAEDTSRPSPAHPQHPQRPPDGSRDELRRRALLVEQAAARRKEQEDKDLEFAIQLDRELNLGELESET